MDFTLPVSLAFLAFASCFLSACASDRIQNEWIAWVPTALTRAQWQQIPAERVHEVAGEYGDEATGLLATVSSRRITASEAERFIGRGLSSHAGASFYLLRSVRTPTRNGHYDVLTHERSVQVLYSALSRRSDTEKSAIVVELDASPETVYVEVTIAS